jgi:hypothetical protein
MIKTLISLPEDDKAWLDTYSHAKRTSVAAVIRAAIKHYRARAPKQEGDAMLAETAGLWRDRGEDGLAYVNRVRAEWES